MATASFLEPVDFAWLWNNKELSDFTLLITTVPVPAPPAPPKRGRLAKAPQTAEAVTTAGDASSSILPANRGRKRARTQGAEPLTASDGEQEVQHTRTTDVTHQARQHSSRRTRSQRPTVEAGPAIAASSAQAAAAGAAAAESGVAHGAADGGTTTGTGRPIRRARLALASGAGANVTSNPNLLSEARGLVAKITGEAGTSRPASAAAGAAAAGAAASSVGAAATAVSIPVHGVVLSAMSEYFKALIRNWSSSLNKVVTMAVESDEVEAARLMVQFMYTGVLPADTEARELLRMIKLADQYQVNRFLIACNASFDRMPLDAISLPMVLSVHALPAVLLESSALQRVVERAHAKLMEMFGDLDKAWLSEETRTQLMQLPHRALLRILEDDDTKVKSENTVLVVVCAWLASPLGASCSLAQRKALFGCVRLPYLSASFVGEVLPQVPWMQKHLSTRALLAALESAVATEATRKKLHELGRNGSGPELPGYRLPRPPSNVVKLSFDWGVEVCKIKQLVLDAKASGRNQDINSEAHYYGGFTWQLMFIVEKNLPEAAGAGLGAEQAQPVSEFVGVRAHVDLGNASYWPQAIRFRATISALQVTFFEAGYTLTKSCEGHIVDGIGLGFPGFFGVQSLDSEQSWGRFVRDGKVHLRCEITECE